MKNMLKIIILFSASTIGNIFGINCDCKYEIGHSYGGQHMKNECVWLPGVFGGYTEYKCKDPNILGKKGAPGWLYCKGGLVEAGRMTGSDGCEKCKNLNDGECYIQFYDDSFSPKWKSGEGFPEDKRANWRDRTGRIPGESWDDLK